MEDGIDVKNVFYVFYFKIKNAFFNVFIFPTFFINKKRWAFLFLSLTTTFSSLVRIDTISNLIPSLFALLFG